MIGEDSSQTNEKEKELSMHVKANESELVSEIEFVLITNHLYFVLSSVSVDLWQCLKK